MLNKLSLNRIGLNRIGLNRIGRSSVGSSGSRPYIDPEVLESLAGVWICDGKTNYDPDRNIIKNKLLGRGGDFEILNAAYKLNSGYGKYEIDFDSWTKTAPITNITTNSFSWNSTISVRLLHFNTTMNDVPSFKFKLETNNNVNYQYIDADGILKMTTWKVSGTYETPVSYNSLYIGEETKLLGFTASGSSGTITQIPSFQGAFVTDGKDDMIVSQKTVQEMLGGSKEITVVSMAVNLDSQEMMCNSIYTNTNGYNIRNTLDANQVVSILGYTDNNVNTNNINLIMGDKNSIKIVDRVNYNASYPLYPINYPGFYYKAAVYWTFIANKVLTTDEINQIIAYFKLDKYVTPQVIYDVKRQGLTNDTPAADWYLKDFSGNGHDMQLYNYAKELNSGIGKYAENFTTWHKYPNVVVTKDKITVTDKFNQDWLVYKYSKSSSGISPMRIKITGIPINARIEYRYAKTSSDTALSSFDILEDGVYDIPESFTINNEYSVGFKLSVGDWTHIEIIQIPDYEGALVSDGKDDYGKAEGLPIFKDYTVAADRAWIGSLDRNQCLATKNLDPNWGAFSFELIQSSSDIRAYSFGGINNISLDARRKISYQSKYSYNGTVIDINTYTDGKDLFLFRSRSAFPYYAEAAVWSYLLFPYSLSEFLLERQLKKYKLGTLYPDMVEFRPVIKQDDRIKNIKYYKLNESADYIDLNIGDYIPVGQRVAIVVDLEGPYEITSITSSSLTNVEIRKAGGQNYAYDILAYVTDKSPQKIGITIDEYIRYEDIVQPYPYIVKLRSLDEHIYTYGDKLKVGDKIKQGETVNLLPGLYEGKGLTLNGVQISSSEAIITVSKSMVFTANKIWLLDTTEPHAIYSPQKLNIPNSSLKILGYVPDLTGKGNHGKLNNFAYTEDSGVAADGSIKFDGTDDHITIPTLAHGGKCVMMKVNLTFQNYDRYLYDQRNGQQSYLAIVSATNLIAYNYLNQGGKTYIDGILNENIVCKDLIDITHNITMTNNGNTKSYSPIIGSSFTKGNFSKMSLYEFMLFPEIPSEDEIKKLNDVMGIEGGYVESPNYYWDAYGKKNTDTDRNLIADQVSKDVANALEVKNVAYNSESGYGGKGFVPFNGDWRYDENKLDFQFITNGIHVTKGKAALSNWFWTNNPTVKGAKTKYKITGVTFDRAIRFFNGLSEYQLVINKDGIYEVEGSLLVDGDGNPTGLSIGDNGWVGDCDIVIEQLTEYPNGLLLDGVEDHAVNTVIPAVTDFTVIAKREWLDKDTIGNECFIHKGAINTPIGETAFMLEYEIVNDVYYRSSSYGGYINIERTNRPEKIVYQTPTSYNGTSITKGSGTDTIGLTLGAVTNNYWKGVFYKMMLYTKTIDQLSINMLKNLFERDELIDVTNPIFKKQ